MPAVFVVLKRELEEAISDRRFLLLCVLTLALTAVAALDGWQRTADSQTLKAQAERIEHETWVGQGSVNPHDAAHFGRFALRPVPPLAAFDPGVYDYAGASVWMEAHFQNPPTNRRAESQLSSFPLTTATPAWILSVVVPMIIIVLLFRSVVGEQERGTLQLLLVQNVPAHGLIVGKCLSALAIVGLFVVLLFATACIPALFTFSQDMDWGRVVGLLLTYLAGYMAMIGTVLAVSAASSSSSQSFWISIFFWIGIAFVVPTVAAQIAQDAHPTPRDREFVASIQEKAQAPFWLGGAQYEEVAVYEAEVMTQHRAMGADELGLNRDALVLQAHERFANRAYDQLYGELYATHLRQESILRLASAFSPILAIQQLSRGLAQTDTISQINFLSKAETHRREIIRQLNEDMMHNAADTSFRYTADKELWEQIENFALEPRSLADTVRSYTFEILCLLVWMMLSFIATAMLIRRKIGSSRL